MRIGEIADPFLRRRVIEVIAQQRGVTPEEIPHWYELDESTYRKLLSEAGRRDDDNGDGLG